MNKEGLAAKLNGREYRDEITREEATSATINGLIVVFGASDDLVELRGAVDDEIGAYGGGVFKIDRLGYLPNFEDLREGEEEEYERYFKRKPYAKEIKAIWNKDGYSWTFETAIPHATFEVLEDGEKFCRGMVIDVSDL